MNLVHRHFKSHRNGFVSGNKDKIIAVVDAAFLKDGPLSVGMTNTHTIVWLDIPICNDLVIDCLVR